MTNLGLLGTFNASSQLASRNLIDFILHVKANYEVNWHHDYICSVVQDFILDNSKKKLMIFLPPQVGKSEIVSRNLPAWVLGKNPKTKIVVVSHSHTFASKFNRDVQRIIDSENYKEAFPNTKLNTKNVASDSKGSWLRNSQEFEIVGEGGSFKSVGVGGGLTGNTVDLLIIDDIVKDASQASSYVFQAKNYEWYKTVAETRLHNNSKIILCNTRWDINDLSGVLLQSEAKDWIVVSIPAIKEDMSNVNDPRNIGDALWESKHSKEKILKVKETSPKTFMSLYQQSPQPSSDLLIFGNSKKCVNLPNVNEVVYGIDFGFSNSKLAVCRLEIDVRQNTIHTEELVYETGVGINELKDILSRLDCNPKSFYYCDGASPENINSLKDSRYGKSFNALSVKKFPNSVLTMIQFLNEFKIFYTANSLNFEFEKNNYVWKIDAFGTPTNQEVDKHNHLFKALMYAVWGHLKQSDDIRLQTYGTKRKGTTESMIKGGKNNYNISIR